MFGRNPHSLIFSWADHTTLTDLHPREPIPCYICGEITGVGYYHHEEGWNCVDIDACSAREAKALALLSAGRTLTA